jgi:hypothetical protein
MTNPFHHGDTNTYPCSFGVRRRNFGHWDIATDQGRAFRVRGGPGAWDVIDERTLPGPAVRVFKDQGAAMGYICAEMMHELIATESQKVHRIEDWNVPQTGD